MQTSPEFKEQLSLPSEARARQDYIVRSYLKNRQTNGQNQNKLRYTCLLYRLGAVVLEQISEELLRVTRAKKKKKKSD